MPTKRRNFGWIRSAPDKRDHRYAGTTALSGAVDLRGRLDAAGRPLLGKPWQQGRLGSCQSHAVGKAWQYVLGLEKRAQPTPSRLFIYWNARALEGTTASDVGATLRDTMSAVHTLGAPPEATWPYVKSKFAVRPPSGAYAQAQAREALEYLSVPQDPDGAAIKSSLAEGYPVAVGFTVYDDSQPYEGNGWYQPLPKLDRADLLGYHAVLVVGHVTRRRKPCWVILDSNGTYADDGYWYMDERYLFDPDLSADFWTLRTVGKA